MVLILENKLKFITYKTALLLIPMTGLILQVNVHAAETSAAGNFDSITRTIVDDYKSFYSGRRMLRMGIGFGIGALPANTNIDHSIQDWYQDDIRSSTTDDMADAFKTFGERKYLLPLTAVAAGLKYFEPESPVGNWGMYSLRAYLTGSPALLLMQAATGGSRPGETNHKSHWRPFKDDNGVSGHSYVGAVPFLAIARMNDNNKLLKYLALAASTATAWSRINDNAHYLSQAALGWYLAWESVDAVFDADEKKSNLSITPVFGKDSYGITAIIVW
jgi:hypothetical protein